MNRIINDRKIFSKLVYWLEFLLKVLPKNDPVHNLLARGAPQDEPTDDEPTDDDSMGDEPTEPPTKRRRISPPHETASPGLQSNVKRGHFEWVGVLFCNVVAQLAWPCAIDELHTTSIPANSTWNLDAATAAKIAGLSLELIWTSPEGLRDHEKDRFISLSQRIFSIWNQCCARDEVTGSEHRLRLFQEHLSIQFLFFRRAFVSWRNEDSPIADVGASPHQSPPSNASKRRAIISECIKSIDRYVCVNSILPLRKAILALKIRDWRSDRTAVTWDQVQKPIEQVSGWAEETEPTGFIAEVAPDFLDLAIRMIPGKGSLQYQQERLWLENFFLGLMYLSSSDVPQMELDENGCLRQQGSHPLELTSRSRILTEHLLQVALRHRFIPSLPLLSYITSVILQDSEVYLPPRYIVRQSSVVALLALDADVFIPNSGLNNSGYCFDQLCHAIKKSGFIDDSKYFVLRDQIIIPLAKSFARARDLETFIKRWSQELQNAIRIDDGSLRHDARTLPVFVWQDEEVFAGLSEILRHRGRPSLTQDLIKKTIDGITFFKWADNSSERTLANADILDCLLSVRPGDAETLHLNLQELFDEIISVLPKLYRDYSSSWRLCSLLTTITAKLLQHNNIDLRTKIQKFDFVSIADISNTKAERMKVWRATQLMKTLQCFRLTAMLVHEQKDFFPTDEKIRDELKALINLSGVLTKSRLTDDGNDRTPRTSWDGRWRYLRTEQDFIDGCIGVILQYPNCLQICSDLTPSLVSRIGRHALAELQSSDHTNGGNQTRQPDIESRRAELDIQRSEKIFDNALAILNTNIVSRNRHLYLECLKALIRAFKNEPDLRQHILFRRIPLHRLPKSLLQELAIDKFPFPLQPLELSQTTEFLQSVPGELAAGMLIDVSRAPLTKARLRKMLAATTHAMDYDRGHAMSEELRKSHTENQESTIVHSVRAATLLLRLNDMDFEKEPRIALQMSSWAALEHIHTVNNGEELCVMLDICKLALTRRPKLINQATIDDLLATLAILTTEGRPHLNAANKDIISTAIFDRLTGIIAILLTRFRRRLQSRYHLLLPCLQNLLGCLYFPGSEIINAREQKSEQQLEFLDHLPFWLTGTSQALPPSSAAKFTRLLTSICDPTASTAARISSNTSELNDATKKARSIAGQYMQYLIMEYTYCTLSGQPGSPAVTARLMPGLYACLDCMPRDLVRCMNDAMDPSSRAVFKGLWEDYGKFGKWDRK